MTQMNWGGIGIRWGGQEKTPHGEVRPVGLFVSVGFRDLAEEQIETTFLDAEFVDG